MRNGGNPGMAERIRIFISNSSGRTLLWTSLTLGIVLGTTYFLLDGSTAGVPPVGVGLVLLACIFGATVITGFAIVILADIFAQVFDGITKRRAGRHGPRGPGGPTGN